MVDISSAESASNAGENTFDSASRRKMRKALNGIGWPLVILLLYVGLSSLFGRVDFMSDAFSQEVANPGEGMGEFGIRYIQHYFVAGTHLVFGFIV